MLKGRKYGNNTKASVYHLKKGRCSRSLKTNGEEICGKKGILNEQMNGERNDVNLMCVVCSQAALPGTVNSQRRCRRKADPSLAHRQLEPEVWSAEV